MRSKEIVGIHHVTAIAGDPQRNIDFYAGVLGLRLIKLTVNYDDPGTYHLYYGDAIGHPGSIMTFFPWPNGEKGQRGTGQLTTTSFSVPESTLDYWMLRFKEHKIAFDGPTTRFDQRMISFADYDGLKLELVEDGMDRRKPWEEGSVAPEKAIRGFHGVTLSEEGYEKTAWLLKDIFGFKP
ncbi:MAG TPA: VOC family protein, partial [Candidatus Saccharimonadales bacterium]|nr:VOC family protein [Candidatus Saccharimonadales bacterium]